MEYRILPLLRLVLRAVWPAEKTFSRFVAFFIASLRHSIQSVSQRSSSSFRHVVRHAWRSLGVHSRGTSREASTISIMLLPVAMLLVVDPLALVPDKELQESK